MEAFNADYYELIYPQYKERSALPILDYVMHGWKEGANPGPLFNIAYYLESNPDVLETGISPLEHYIRSNGGAAFPDLANASRVPEHIRSQIEDIAMYLSVKAGLFNASFYREKYGEQACSPSPLAHYRQKGWREGKSPSAIYAGNPLFKSLAAPAM